jgi:hypothetical protein
VGIIEAQPFHKLRNGKGQEDEATVPGVSLEERSHIAAGSHPKRIQGTARRSHFSTKMKRAIGKSTISAAATADV